MLFVLRIHGLFVSHVRRCILPSSFPALLRLLSLLHLELPFGVHLVTSGTYVNSIGSFLGPGSLSLEARL